MPARFVRSANQENISTTLNGAITASATTITVNDASNLLAPGYLIIDRVDAAGNLRSTAVWEYVYVSAISGNDLTVTRGQGGSTAQAHSNAAVIEAVVTAAAWEDLRLSYINEHGSEGAHTSMASVSWIETRNLVVPSVASVADLRPASIFGARGVLTSVLSVADLRPTTFEGIRGVLTSVLSVADIRPGAFEAARGTFTSVLSVADLRPTTTEGARAVLTSVASIAALFAATRLDASGASVSGIARTFVWYMPGFASAATTNVMRLITPFGGTFQSFTMTTRTPVSTASLTIAVYNIRSGASIFDTVGRPAILGGGTLVSTASVKTPNFISGDVLRVDIENGGSVADVLLEGIAY